MVFRRDGGELKVTERLSDDPTDIRSNSRNMTIEGDWNDASLTIGRDTVQAIVEAAPDDWL